jgi:hypothetical protein
MDPCASVLETTAWVTSSAKHVTIVEDALAEFSSELKGLGEPPSWDNGWHYCDDVISGGPLTAQYTLVLDALNWCFWPSATSMEYDTLALGLARALRANPTAFSARALQELQPDTLRSWFAPHDLPAAEERARKLNEVGVVLEASFEGSAAALVAAARGSAVALVRLVAANFPGFRDESVYRGRQVFFYKRAQVHATLPCVSCLLGSPTPPTLATDICCGCVGRVWAPSATTVCCWASRWADAGVRVPICLS